MEYVISQLLHKYENGLVGRRQVIQSLALLIGASGTASAAGVEGKGIDHVSLTVLNPQRTAEFYKKIFALSEVRQDIAANGEVRLGRAGDRALIAIRPGNPASVIDHFALGVEPFETEAVRRDLKDRGAVLEGDTLYFKDPDGIRVQVMPSVPR
jgi:catechol 2,3-dioxygenase-like lactoylglutathione lyase family enzyme